MRRALLALCLLLGGLVQAHALEVGIVGGPNPQLWPVYIARKYAMFGPGMTLDLVSAPSSAAIVQQVAAGSLAMSISSGLSDPIRAAAQGADVAVVRIDGGVAPYALLGKSSIKSLADLRGKIVSIGGAKDITRVYLERMLAPSGLKSTDVDLVFAGATAARYSALSAGAVDAAILFPPFIFRGMAAGYSNLGLVVDFAPELPFSGLGANTKWAAANPGQLKAILDGYTRALVWMHQPEHRAEAITMMIEATKSDAADIEQTFDFLAKIGFYDENPMISRRKLTAIADVLKSDGDIPATTPIEKLVLPGTQFAP